MKKITALLFLLMLTLASAGCTESAISEEELSPIVSQAIISENEGLYLDGECCGEGHKILGSSLKDNILKVYALTMTGNYGFQNDMFIKISGSGVIPAVLNFEKDGEDYKLLEIEYPTDGDGYEESIKQMFPEKYRSEALNPGENVYEELQSKEHNYAEEYLKSIGREARIGEYADLNTVLLTDRGVSVDVSNKLVCDNRLWQYPYWIGTLEALEDEVRYVYSLSFDETQRKIVFEKTEKESGEVTETFVFDADTGKEIIPGEEKEAENL